MKILVTGAGGYLGCGIVKSILDNGHKVVASDLDNLISVDDRANKIKCNIFDIKNPFEYFEKPDVLLHLAWRDGFSHYSDVHIIDLPKHYSFIKNMAESGIRRISVMGSMHEVGFFEGCVKSYTDCHPITLYGVAKNALREMTQILTDRNNVKFQWLRGFYIVGNFKYGSSIFSKIAKAAGEGKTEFPFTKGQNRYDFIDYSDFCTRVAAAVGQDEINGIINICSGKPEKLADRVENFIKENGYNIKLQYSTFPEREYDSKAIWGSSAKIKMILAAKRYKV